MFPMLLGNSAPMRAVHLPARPYSDQYLRSTYTSIQRRGHLPANPDNSVFCSTEQQWRQVLTVQRAITWITS
jgi:hypothetical protein